MDLTCPKCLKKTSHVSLEYVAQKAQTEHGKKIKIQRVQRVGEWVKCLDCSFMYISTEERNKNGEPTGRTGTGNLQQ